ncbi:hypothetical protein C5E45_32700 [Nocardia nova]|uniref:DUF4239 domain-containing protein n=2 Tax=Nocardia nova TaxID=37330 RepID=A0A2S6ACM6_9NOCA|nr:hypothetical protein C5E45_32700 [Nocardia nova]
MVTNSLPEALIISAVSFIAGVVVGQFVRFRREPSGGRNVLVPELDRRPFSGRWFRLIVVGLFLISTGLIVQFTVDQRACNAEYQRTITLRADAAAASDKALYDIVNGLLTIPQGSPDGRERVQELLRQYQTTYNEKLNSRASNPYPRC